VNSLLLQNREWLIQPDALRSMIAAAESFRALGNPVVPDQASSSLLSIQDRVATVSISGPVIRKPDIFARVLMGVTDPTLPIKKPTGSGPGRFFAKRSICLLPHAGGVAGFSASSPELLAG